MAIVESIFGPTPEQVRQAQQAQMEQRAVSYASMDPLQRYSQGMYQAGGQLVDIGAGMLGMEPKAVTEARQREELLAQVDMSTPEGILKGAELARQRGDVRTQLGLQQLAAQRQKELKEGGARPEVARLLEERAKYPEGSESYKALTEAIRKETYIKPEREAEGGLKPSDELKYMNQHSKDYQSAVTVIDSSTDALKLTDSIQANPKFGYLFGGYTEKTLAKFAPGEIAGLQSDVNTLKANLMSTGLNLVKSASQAGIGSITEKEWPIFERMITDLDPKMDEKTARNKLQKITDFFDRTQRRSAEAYKKKWRGRKDFYDPEVETMLYKPRGTTQRAPTTQATKAGGVPQLPAGFTPL